MFQCARTARNVGIGHRRSLRHVVYAAVLVFMAIPDVAFGDDETPENALTRGILVTDWLTKPSPGIVAKPVYDPDTGRIAVIRAVCRPKIAPVRVSIGPVLALAGHEGKGTSVVLSARFATESLERVTVGLTEVTGSNINRIFRSLTGPGPSPISTLMGIPVSYYFDTEKKISETVRARSGYRVAIGIPLEAFQNQWMLTITLPVEGEDIRFQMPLKVPDGVAPFNIPVFAAFLRDCGTAAGKEIAALERDRTAQGEASKAKGDTALRASDFVSATVHYTDAAARGVTNEAIVMELGRIYLEGLNEVHAIDSNGASWTVTETGTAWAWFRYAADTYRNQKALEALCRMTRNKQTPKGVAIPDGCAPAAQ